MSIPSSTSLRAIRSFSGTVIEQPSLDRRARSCFRGGRQEIASTFLFRVPSGSR
jgi:hypothetical protein